MLKTLYNIFPIFDHLYIYQVLEYSSWDFFQWFLKSFEKRNLQRKHKLSFTRKASVLLSTSIILMAAVSWLLVIKLGLHPIALVPEFILLQLLSPIFLIISGTIYKPLDIYLKNKILGRAKQKLARLPNLKVVAITGSFGKTSTKDILYTLLWKKYYVVKTPKSFNTPLGVAQTILEDVKNNTQILIAEIGAYKRGEIRKIAELVKPRIGIVTAVAPQHLERFGSLENIALAKFELVEGLKEGGLAILNGDSTHLQSLASHLPGVLPNFYGSENDPYYAADIKTGIEGTSFILHTPRGKTEIKIPLIGEHHAQNFLAASGAALELGLTLKEIKERAGLLLPTPHRLEIRKQGTLTIIDNTYNTNPKAARASLKLLKGYLASQKIIITPGLVELGKEAPKENQELAKDAAGIVDDFVIVGENAKKDLLKGLKEAKFPTSRVHLVESTQAGINLLATIAKTNAVFLLENDLPDQYF